MTAVNFKVELELGSESDAFPHGLHVVKLQGAERIGAPYRFVVEVLTRADEHLSEEVVGRAATIRLFAKNAIARTIRGVVQCFEEGLDVASKDYSRYRLVVTPRLADLARFEMQDVYVGLGYPQVLRTKLEHALQGCEPVMRLQQPAIYGEDDWNDGNPDATAAQGRMVVQYRESDLAFVSRLAEHIGLGFFFEDNGDEETLVFTDHTDGYKEHDGLVAFDGDRDGVGLFKLTRRVSAVASNFFVYDYSYRTPQLTFEVDGKMVFDVLGGHAALDTSSSGAHLEYAPNAKTMAEAALLARVRADAEEGTRERFTATGTCPGLYPGVRFFLEHHPKVSTEDELLVVGAVHRFVGATPFASVGPADPPVYEVELDLVRARKQGPDRRAIHYRPQRTTPRPRIYGVVTGIIKGAAADSSSGQQNLDGQGRYLVKLHFDQTPATLPRVRMAQPTVGEGYGQHFPLRPGVEVIVAFLDGDPDRPVIVGAVPNPLKQSPVTAPRPGEDDEVSRIQTRSGIRIQFSDGTKG